MRAIRINAAKLLTIVKKNRTSHRTLFLKAQKGYREEVITELDRMLKEARDGKRIRRVVELEEPIDQTDAYDRVIGMLEHGTEKEVELTAQEFDWYVRDQWIWAAHVATSNMKYVK